MDADKAQITGGGLHPQGPRGGVMTTLPGPIRQIGYVVTDIDRAMATWVALGVGPWFVMRNLPMQALYRGQPCETTLTVAWSNSGEMQVELIQQLDATPSIFTEFLTSHGPGFHQIAYWTTDFDETMRAVENSGWPVVWSGGENYGVRFAYLDIPDGPAAVVEISELTDATAANAVFTHDAAAEWDGSAPIRELGG